MTEIDATVRLRGHFRPLGELFNRLIESKAGFSGSFLWLDPHKWAIQHFGVALQRAPTQGIDPRNSAEGFLKRFEEKRRGRDWPRNPEELFEAVWQVAHSDSVYTPQMAYQGAVDLLHLNIFPPGNAYSKQSGGFVAVNHWCLPGEDCRQDSLRPLTNFQEVLDLAALFDFRMHGMQAERVDSLHYRLVPSPLRAEDSVPLVMAENFAKRPGLIDQENSAMLVAEYIQTFGPERQELDAQGRFANPSWRVDEYFMPLRGLGQWRAAFEYKMLRRHDAEPGARVEGQFSTLARGALEELFTTALINVFTQSLLDAESLDDLYQAFATLWWAREISFGRLLHPDRPYFSQPHWVSRQGWCPIQRSLTSLQINDNPNPDDVAPEAFERFGHTHSGWLQIGPKKEEGSRRTLRLNLGLLKELADQKVEFLQRWGFDLIEFECDLVSSGPDTGTDFHRWADKLGDELVQARTRTIHELHAQSEAEYSSALFAFGHHVGKLFQESGLAGFRPERYTNDTAELLKLVRMKKRLMLAWGVGEATRPLRHEGRGYPGPWFPVPFQPVEPQKLIKALEELCQYYLSALIDQLPSDWKINWCRSDIRWEQSIQELIKTAIRPLPTVPPFDPSDPQQPATVAITIGLAEQLRNFRQHWLMNKSDLVRGYESGAFSSLASIEIEVDSQSQSCQIKIEGIAYHLEQAHLDSRQQLYAPAIEQIQQLEKKALSILGDRIIETSQPAYVAEEGRYRYVRTLWKYNYGKVRIA